MKFKEIKPGMVIHCPREENVWELLKNLKAQGYRTCGIPAFDNCYLYIDDVMGGVMWSGEKTAKEITEFSDLIEPDSDAQYVYGSWNRLEANCFRCPECGCVTNTPSNYCPNCAKNMYDDSPINSDIDSPMTAEELLRQLREIEREGKTTDVFGCCFESILDFQTDEEIMEDIAKYEAEKKKPKHEVRDGFRCQIYGEGLVESFELWDKGRDDVEAYAIEQAHKYTSETGIESSVSVWPICEVKEDEA